MKPSFGQYQPSYVPWYRSPFAHARRRSSWTASWWSGSVVRMNRSGLMSSPASASRNRATIESTNARGVIPRCSAVIAMLTEYSSVPVRNSVSSPSIRCHRAIVSAPITS